MSTDAKFDTYIASCPCHERLRLAAWCSSNNGRRITYGAIVRSPVAELFKDELMMKTIHKPYIYGIATNEEEYDETSTLSD